MGNGASRSPGGGGEMTSVEETAMAANLEKCFADCEELVREKHCAPLLLRFAWHAAGTFDASDGTGGATGSIRFDKELAHVSNGGLDSARALLEPLKKKYPTISYADLYQMAGAAAVEQSGGPRIPMKYGRVDAPTDDSVPPPHRLPDGDAPFHQSDGKCPFDWSQNASPEAHLRRVFYRMGLSDQEIVALSGGHTLGRAFKHRSGIPKLPQTSYTEKGPGETKGGMSWTREWLKFDNSYFRELKDAKEGRADPELLRMPTDLVLFTDKKFKKFAKKYAKSQAAFFEDYAVAHAKLSELGATFEPPQGIEIKW